RLTGENSRPVGSEIAVEIDKDVYFFGTNPVGCHMIRQVRDSDDLVERVFQPRPDRAVIVCAIVKGDDLEPLPVVHLIKTYGQIAGRLFAKICRQIADADLAMIAVPWNWGARQGRIKFGEAARTGGQIRRRVAYRLIDEWLDDKMAFAN